MKVATKTRLENGQIQTQLTTVFVVCSLDPSLTQDAMDLQGS
jgi:hypothetical protein